MQPPRTHTERTARLYALLVLGLCTVPDTVPAVTVHTWVDTGGIRHYADLPPASGDTTLAQIEIPDSGTPAGGDDYYSIVNQWQRLRAEREADAERALERARIAAVRAAAAAPPPDYGADRGGYFVYPPYGYPYRAHRGSGRHHSAHHPAGLHRGPAIGRRNAYVNAPPPVWPSQREFR